MNLLEIRQRLDERCEEEGGAVGFAKKYGFKAHSYISAVRRGDIRPSRRLLKAIGVKKKVTKKKNEEPKYEDITN